MAYMEGNLSIPQPRKPMPADKTIINYGHTANSNVNKAANYLMEMLKFMPDYKRKEFDLSVTADDYAQYEGNFGQLVDAINMRSFGGAYGVEGLQFQTDNAADFQHLDGEQISRNPINTLISSAMWSKATKTMQEETRSYYDIMMTGVDDMSPDEAFSLLVTMLESRTRVSTTLANIFGRSDQSSDKRIEIFNAWYEENINGIEPEKGAFLSFFLNVSQPFVAHILPMYGQSNEQYASELDKMNSQSFMETLTAKITQYINSLSGTAQDEAKAIWADWLNPAGLPTADKNIDPMDTEWGEEVYGKLQEELDAIIHQNIANRVSYRARYEQYKKDKEEYDEKIEEEEKLELRTEQAQQKKQAEQRALDEKIAAQNRENSKVRIAPKEKEKEKEKPVQQAKQVQAKPVVARQTAKQVAKAPAKPIPKTTAAAPAKVNAAKPQTAVSSKPMFRVRKGSVGNTASTAVKKTAAVAKVSNARVKVATARRKVRPRRKPRVWGRPSVFKL